MDYYGRDRELHHKEIANALSQLDKRYRGLRAALLLLLAVGVLVCFASGTDVVSASSQKSGVYEMTALLLVGKDGKTRGIWTVNEDNDVVLLLYDGNDNARLALRVDPKGYTELSYRNSKEDILGAWIVASNGESELILNDSNGKTRIAAKVTPNIAAIQLSDARGTPRLLSSVIDLGRSKKAELGLYGPNGKRRLALMSTSDGTPAIVFPDKNDPLRVEGGWYVMDDGIKTMSKGQIASVLSEK